MVDQPLVDYATDPASQALREVAIIDGLARIEALLRILAYPSGGGASSGACPPTSQCRYPHQQYGGNAVGS